MASYFKPRPLRLPITAKEISMRNKALAQKEKKKLKAWWPKKDIPMKKLVDRDVNKIATYVSRGCQWPKNLSVKDIVQVMDLVAPARECIDLAAVKRLAGWERSYGEQRIAIEKKQAYEQTVWNTDDNQCVAKSKKEIGKNYYYGLKTAALFDYELYCIVF